MDKRSLFSIPFTACASALFYAVFFVGFLLTLFPSSRQLPDCFDIDFIVCGNSFFWFAHRQPFADFGLWPSAYRLSWNLRQLLR
jgi:hypothetical protein